MEKLNLINKEESGLTENKAKEIRLLYEPMVNMIEKMEVPFNEIVQKEVTKELIPEIKRLRLDISQVRIQADKVRKSAKEEILRAGGAIQGAYNNLLYAVKSKEEKLFKMENHFIELEKQAQIKKQEERANELAKYGADLDNLEHVNLGAMPDDVFENYLIGQKTVFKAQQDAVIKAEKERVKKEAEDLAEKKKRELDQIRIKKENAILIEKAEKAEKERKEIELKRKKELDEIKEKQAKKDLKAKQEKEAELLKAKKKEEVANKEIERVKAESEEKELIKQAEIDSMKAKAEALENERLLSIENAKKLEQEKLNQGDKENREDLINELKKLTEKYTFKSQKNIRMYNGVQILIEKVINHINSL